MPDLRHGLRRYFNALCAFGSGSSLLTSTWSPHWHDCSEFLLPEVIGTFSEHVNGDQSIRRIIMFISMSNLSNLSQFSVRLTPSLLSCTFQTQSPGSLSNGSLQDLSE
jgi:hypothetical protein